MNGIDHGQHLFTTSTRMLTAHHHCDFESHLNVIDLGQLFRVVDVNLVTIDIRECWCKCLTGGGWSWTEQWCQHRVLSPHTHFLELDLNTTIQLSGADEWQQCETKNWSLSNGQPDSKMKGGHVSTSDSGQRVFWSIQDYDRSESSVCNHAVSDLDFVQWR